VEMFDDVFRQAHRIINTKTQGTGH
jgi:hypothetical protein